MKLGRLSYIILFLTALAAIAEAVFLYLEIMWNGFPDGYVSPYHRIRKYLYISSCVLLGVLSIVNVLKVLHPNKITHTAVRGVLAFALINALHFSTDYILYNQLDHGQGG